MEVTTLTTLLVTIVLIGRLNFEVNAVLYDEKAATQLHSLFLQDCKDSSEYSIARYKDRSILNKFKEAITRLLSPIL
ncbi:hypothetical protein J1P26_12890 [Neobacillus sp. MM2021_6]|uniref:hypothetical protein n=1 Tax=Bacillaceae TaxID=186817 RepID=UPI001A94912D|nr:MULTISPECIES: hypothetical protein [Bacillaceae]MBO0960594.1 hypothetical protein [Neobacillus sp. MM2021_6]